MRKAIALGLLAGVFAMGVPVNASAQDSGLLAIGEMGIGNTSAAAALSCLLTGIPLDELVGAGTGISEH